MYDYDLVIRGGTVIDGTGLTRRRADVGVRAGRIADVGFADAGAARRSIDAEGLIVAPGIIDAHTHYDPQLTFDPWATSSCYHGVTTVLAGNCGFSIAPTRAGDRPYITRMFAKVEGMSPAALGGVDWRFETFPEYLDALEGRLGVNAAFYIGHSTLRRFVLGDAATRRRATAAEVEAMRALVGEAIEAGAAGFSSSHGPSQFDGDGSPIPSRLADTEELRALVEAAGRGNAGSISYLPHSAVAGGMTAEDAELLIDLGQRSRLPIVIQGLGGRSKTDAPEDSDWPEAQAFLARAARAGAAVFSLLRTQPFNRAFDLLRGTALYDGVPEWARVVGPGAMTPAQRLAALRNAALREQMRWAVEHPNTDPSKGNTLVPPPWSSVLVNRVARPEHAPLLGRSIEQIAREQGGRPPADVLLDLALADELQTGFLWSSENPTWARAVAQAQRHPAMLMGVSDGGAHLDRDDSSDWSSYFLSRWVIERQLWTLEEGVRQLTQVPAALLGLRDRGLLLPGYAADLMLFDPEAIAPGTKDLVHDLPGGEARFCARPRGIRYTIVNGEPIVVDGELTGATPGEVLRPGKAVQRRAPSLRP
jgi:N-acyl-D-aspartate/D-glutamate deacylase